MKDVMLDLETLDTVSTAIIVSIGACKFDRNGGPIGDTFYVVCNLSQPGRTFSASTLEWWMSQDTAARAVFSDPIKLSLASSLLGLAEWMSHDDYFVWSNGASFDIPIIEHACRALDVPTPWAYNHSRCFRTMAAEAPHLDRPKPNHNALDDAIGQAKHLQDVYRVMHKR